MPRDQGLGTGELPLVDPFLHPGADASQAVGVEAELAGIRGSVEHDVSMPG